MPLYLPADAEAELRTFMAAGLHLAPCNAVGVPTSRIWRAQASARPEALSAFMRQSTCAGFIARLGQGLCVVTVRGLRAEGLAPVEDRLGALPETVTSRLPGLTAMWFRHSAGLPNASLSKSVAVRAGQEGSCQLPPSLTRGQVRWAWAKPPSSTAIARLPERWEAEARRVSEVELVRAA